MASRQLAMLPLLLALALASAAADDLEGGASRGLKQTCAPMVCKWGYIPCEPLKFYPAGTLIADLPKSPQAPNNPLPCTGTNITIKTGFTCPKNLGTQNVHLVDACGVTNGGGVYLRTGLPVITVCFPHQVPTVACTASNYSCKPGETLTPAAFGCSVTNAANPPGTTAVPAMTLLSQWGNSIGVNRVCPVRWTTRYTVSTAPNGYGCTANIYWPKSTRTAAVGQCYEGGVLTPAPALGSVIDPGSGVCNTTWNMTDFSAIFPGKGFHPGYVPWAGWDNWTLAGFNEIPLYFNFGSFDSIVSEQTLYGYNAGADRTWGADWPCSFNGRIYSTSNGTNAVPPSVTLRIPTGITALSFVVDTFKDFQGTADVSVSATDANGNTIGPFTQTISQLGPGFARDAKLFGVYAGNGYLTSVTISGPPEGIAFGELIASANIVCAP